MMRGNCLRAKLVGTECVPPVRDVGGAGRAGQLGCRATSGLRALLLRPHPGAATTDRQCRMVLHEGRYMVAALRVRTSSTLRDDDLLPQVVSWIVAATIGAGWLVIVYLAPAPVVLKPGLAEPLPPSVAFEPGRVQAPAQPAYSIDGGPTSRGPRSHLPMPRSLVNAAGLFGAAAAAGIVQHIEQFIPGAIAVSGEAAAPSAATKSALSANEHESTPGMTQMSRGNGGAAGGASLGSVGGGSSIAHVGVHVKPLPIVQAAPLGAETADATEMGSFVRGRVAQLQTCYERAGGTDLAGFVALRLTIGAGGSVQSADIARRSWSGPGSAATESCLLNMVKSWRVPFAAEGTTVTIPISFTRGT